MDRYRVFTNADREGQSRWYHQCERQQTFLVQAVKRTKLAKVEWDYITLAGSRESIIRDREKEVSSALIEIFRSVAGPRSEYFGSATVGHMDGIPIEYAEAAAAQIADLYEQILTPAS